MNNQRNDGPSVEQLRAELERVRYRRRYMSTLRSTIYMLVALATVVLLARAITRLMETHYAPMFHGIIGIVTAATVVIIPFASFASGISACLINLGCLCLGIAAAQMLNRFNASVPKPE